MPKNVTTMAPLRDGQHIGIIALSAPVQDQRFERGLEYLRTQKIEPKIALNPAKAYGSNEFGFSSDTPERRAKALEDLFKDPTVGAILAARGAYGSMEILPHLNFDLIAKHPKPFIGFSDTTAVLVALYQKSKSPVIHGPSLESSFSKAKEDGAAKESADTLLAYLNGKLSNPYQNRQLKHFSGNKTLQGKLVGGNLSMLVSLLGTPYAPSFKDHIVFFEESNERPYRIHRMLMQLKLAGLFEGLRGVLLGDFKNCVHEKGLGPSCEDVFHSIFGAYNLSVFADAPSGHSMLNLPVPFGIEAKVSNNQLQLEL